MHEPIRFASREELVASNRKLLAGTAIVSTCFFIRKGELDDTFKIAEILLGDDQDLGGHIV